MASSVSPGDPVNTQGQKGRKSTQRERLAAGMAEVAVREGYAAASVAQVIAHAGVSRPTFYDYFSDKQACFLAVHRELAASLLERVELALERETPAHAAQAVVKALVELANSEPTAARYLMQETMAAGPDARDERDHTISQIAQIVERALARAPTAPAPDVSTRALVGGVYRVLSLRLRRGERDFEPLAGELVRWLAAYEQPSREHRWRSLRPGPMPAQVPESPELLWRPPLPLPRGRRRLSEAEVSQNQRERILCAAVHVAHEKGYAATTIAHIAATGRIDRRIFYRHFQDKQDAFLTALEQGIQRAVALTALSFFGAPTWPERVWEAGLALTSFMAVNPAFAHVGVIEAYAIGPTAVQRFEDLRTAFTIFLQEGHQHQSVHVDPPSAAALEAVAAVAFEIAYHELRHGRIAGVARLLPHVVFLCLAPFLGAQAANEFIDAKLQEARSSRRGDSNRGPQH
jgi:AcrR family transcriptional regulator